MNRARKTILSSVGDSGSNAEVDKPSKRIARKDFKPGTNSRDRQNPKAQRARKIEAWCQGKAEKYA